MLRMNIDLPTHQSHSVNSPSSPLIPMAKLAGTGDQRCHSCENAATHLQCDDREGRSLNFCHEHYIDWLLSDLLCQLAWRLGELRESGKISEEDCEQVAAWYRRLREEVLNQVILS